MSQGRHRRSYPAVHGVGKLASDIFSRIAGGHNQPGAATSFDWLAGHVDAPAPDILAALAELEQAHALVRCPDGWELAGCCLEPRNPVLARHRPGLESLLAAAVAGITPGQAAGLFSAYDRLAGLAGDGSAATRAAAYGLYLRRLAEATPDAGFAPLVELFLAEAGETVSAFTALQIERRPPDPDEPLARLARALMAGRAEEAAAAFAAHLDELAAA
ncbi:hypothetical protein FJQ54_14950 [Sandaracinobacter neustonicus]|uniref:Uncharacterized protein n=1 Tax=Sandaracinobacter neustonicus TaxID=1715348 RepID=A0A501XEZ8_9SPHN|nr:hypothetical protein [Sandaracinobacter neustonicus]TPE59090.1 hypothetical protein FJQ54_14950 [Sandaracinobacter neustonicus]